jgi:excisionase family DNA binding protein
MIKVDGKEYPTVTEAAKTLRVSKKTIYVWIAEGVLPGPPTVRQGLKAVQYFPDSYLRSADATIKRRAKRSQRRAG